MFVIRKEPTEMIEHNGKFYSPEDLAKLLEIQGNIDIVDSGDNFFSRAMDELEGKEE